jgi:SNF2 family DNA or RNA helicase
VTFKGELYGFQKEAVDMMLDRQYLLLAHGLGLGKTVTSIAACETLIDEGKAEAILVVAPASVKWQWARQLAKFTDGALVKVIEGPKGERRSQYRSVKRGDVEYCIMNYEQIVADWDILRLLAWDVVIGDEIVAIKNPGAKRSRHVKRLQAPYKFGLSGQPIENRPEELYSIMQWVDPDVLGRFDIFDRTFIRRNSWGAVKYYRNLRTLRKLMGGAMHRVTRHDVRDQMPSIVEKSYLIEFDPAARKLYRQIVSELLDVIHSVPKFSSFNLMNHYHGVNDGGAMGEIMPRLMALRMLCDHPYLLSYSAAAFDDPDTQAGSQYIAGLRAAGVFQPLKNSPKMKETIRLIREILDADPRNKVVLFSFFKPMLWLLGENLGCTFGLFTGDQTPRERDEVVEQFTSDKNCRVLLSSDAGGVGVDIPVANYLISYDLPWSSGKFTQRQGRIDRISSEWPEITLLSMIMRGSIEERMYDMLMEKAAVADAWLDGKGVDARGTFTLTLGSLADFLEERHLSRSGL